MDSSDSMGKTTGNGNGDFDGDGPDDPDTGLWAYVIRTVRPLRRDVSLPVPQAPARPARKAKRHDLPTSGNTEEFAGLLKTPTASAPPPHAAGLDRRTEERLRRGQMDIEAVLDLHGLNVAQARPRLERFLISGQAQGLRCVLIITGKGRASGRQADDDFYSPVPKPGILKRSLPEWLAEPPLSHIVLRHFPAKGRHGGSGAFYVLLRRLR